MRLPILMYHDIHEDNNGPYSIHTDKLILQFDYLKNNGFTAISTQQLINFIDNSAPLPPKPVLITFDDGYKTIVTTLYPILLERTMKAVAFIVPSFINESNSANEKYLSIADIKKISGEYIEWGIHSYNHGSFKKQTVLESTEDIKMAIAWFNKNQISFTPSFAFPYGAYPKRSLIKKKHFFFELSVVGMKLFFRIGNRMNYLNKKNSILFQRIDITGDETIKTFEKYLRNGKRKTII